MRKCFFYRITTPALGAYIIGLPFKIKKGLKAGNLKTYTPEIPTNIHTFGIFSKNACNTANDVANESMWRY